MTEIKESNWHATRTGALATAAITAALTALIYLQIDLKIPILLSALGGLVLAASIKTGNMKKYATVAKPVSAALTMASGTLILLSTVEYARAAFQRITETLTGTSTIQGIIDTVIQNLASFSGYSLATTAAFITATGTALIYWDRVDTEKTVGTRKQDIYFNIILVLVAVFMAFGTAIINNIPITKVTGLLQKTITVQGKASGIVAGLLLIAAYITLGRAWRALPIREMVPRNQIEYYDKLKKAETFFKWLLLPAIAAATAATPMIQIKVLEYLAPLTTVAFRNTLATVTAASITLLATSKILKILAGDRKTVTRFIPYLVFAAAAYLAGNLLAPHATATVNQSPQFIQEIFRIAKSRVGTPAIVVAGMAAAASLAVSLKTSVKSFKGMGFIPKGLEGTFLASTGIFIASVGLHLYQPIPVMLLLGVASSLTVWEIGKRSAVLGREIGRKGTSTRSELVQITSKIVVAVLAVIAARTLLFLIQGQTLEMPSSGLTTVVTVLSALAAVLLAFSMKEVS